MSSRFIYLYLFKHSLKVHASRVACFTHFNCHNPDHYHCTSSAELCYTAIIPWREEEGKKKTPQTPIKPSSVPGPLPGYFHIPLPGPDPDKQDFPSTEFAFSSAGNADTQVLLRQGSTKWRRVIVLLGFAAFDLLVSLNSYSLPPHF